MSENEKKMSWNVSSDANAVTNFLGEQVKRTFNESDKPRLLPGQSMDGEYEASEILEKYLHGLKYCGRKKRHRCISQELESECDDQ